MDITKNTTGIDTALGFKATRNDDGSMTIHAVPIFVRCKRGEHDFNEAWIDKAVAASKLAEAEGYLPPLHIRHHAPGADDAVRAVGVFRLLGKSPIVFKGKTRPGILADLIVTCPGAQQEVMEKRLPYRSVEIFNVDNPRIDGLALLDHEAPFLELPMLVVNQVSGGAQTAAEAVGVAGATFKAGWQMDAGVNDQGVVACFTRGRTAHLLMESNMADKTPEQIAAEEAKRVALADGGEGDKPGGDKPKKDEDMEGGEGGGIDAKGCAKAIASGAISLADFQLIKDAMETAEAASGEGEGEETPANVAPAATPGEAMSKQYSPEAFAKLQGENEANAAAIVKMQADTARTGEVDAALVKLDGKPLGADLKERLTAFHAEHGAKAFLSYVDGLASATPTTPDITRGADAFGGSANDIPEAAMKYEAKGADAVEKAAKFAREWKALHDSGHTRMAEARYIEVNMERAPA